MKDSHKLFERRFMEMKLQQLNVLLFSEANSSTWSQTTAEIYSSKHLVRELICVRCPCHFYLRRTFLKETKQCEDQDLKEQTELK